jgi:hypothetical protein
VNAILVAMVSIRCYLIGRSDLWGCFFYEKSGVSDNVMGVFEVTSVMSPPPHFND